MNLTNCPHPETPFQHYLPSQFHPPLPTQPMITTLALEDPGELAKPPIAPQLHCPPHLPTLDLTEPQHQKDQPYPPLVTQTEHHHRAKILSTLSQT